MRHRIQRLRHARLNHVEAAFGLLLARLVYLVPFRWLAPWLGTLTGHQAAPTPLAADHDRLRAAAVGRAISAVSDWLPWHSSCLVCALAACLMLRRRGLPSHLQLGVRLDGEKRLAAHAWVTCGDIEIVGTGDATTYQPLATFTAER